MHSATIDCEECNEGRVERSSDHLNARGEHYTRDWTEACARCNGTGRVEMDAAELNVEQGLAHDTDHALGIGAATELPLTPDQRAEVDHLVRLSRNDSDYSRRAAERQVRLYPQFYPAVRS